MRVAVLADIHGNLPALEAVLAEVDRLAVDRIVLNGDIAAGPLPGQTLDRLAGLPLTVTLQVDGLGTVLCCHATPRRDDEMLLVDSPPTRYAEALGAAGAGR